MHAGLIRLLDLPMAAFAAPVGVKRRQLSFISSGGGQDRHAPSAGSNVTRTVERARPRRRQISLTCEQQPQRLCSEPAQSLDLTTK